MTKKQRAAEAVRLLKEAYPDAVCSLDYVKPHELLISVRLAAQCTDARVNMVTEVLFKKFFRPFIWSECSCVIKMP